MTTNQTNTKSNPNTDLNPNPYNRTACNSQQPTKCSCVSNLPRKYNTRQCYCTVLTTYCYRPIPWENNSTLKNFTSIWYSRIQETSWVYSTGCINITYSVFLCKNCEIADSMSLLPCNHCRHIHSITNIRSCRVKFNSIDIYIPRRIEFYQYNIVIADGIVKIILGKHQNAVVFCYRRLFLFSICSITNDCFNSNTTSIAVTNSYYKNVRG